MAAATAAALEEEKQWKVAWPARAQADSSTNISGVDEQTRVSSEDFLDFSDTYRSNGECYRKLGRLKAAHTETMAKSEKNAPE